MFFENVTGDCSVQFYFNPEPRSWDGAQADCRGLDPSGKLAVPTDEKVFSRINALYQKHRTESTNAFLGLRDFLGTTGTKPDSFVSIEGTVNAFTAEVLAGQPPWRSDAPDTGDCVALSFADAEGLIIDTICTGLGLSVCQRSCNGQNTPDDDPSAGTRPETVFGAIPD